MQLSVTTPKRCMYIVYILPQCSWFEPRLYRVSMAHSSMFSVPDGCVWRELHIRHLAPTYTYTAYTRHT